MLSVLNVDKNVKFRSSQIQADLYTAENVMVNEDPREEIDIKLQSSIYSQHMIFFYNNIFSFSPENCNIRLSLVQSKFAD